MENLDKKWGLVLSGGGFSASYGVGVMQALLHDYKLPKPAVVVGASASAPTACLFSTGQVDEAVDVWTNKMTDPDFLLREEGAACPKLDVERVVNTVREHLDFLRLVKDDAQVYFTVTDLKSHGPTILDTKKARGSEFPDEALFFDMMRASMALPGTYGKVVQINGNQYVDGDISSSNAHKVDFIRSLGVQPVMVVNSTRMEMGKELLKIMRATGEKEISDILRANYKTLLQTPDCTLISPSEKLPCGLFKSNKREDIEFSVELGRRDTLLHKGVAEFAEFLHENNLPRLRPYDFM